MEAKTLPTKAAQDAKHELIRRDAPDKDERSALSVATDRAHLPAKAAVKKDASGGQEQRAQTHGDPPNGGTIDQQRPEWRSRGGEYYVRLTIQVDNGNLSIVDSHVVEGPLAQTTAFHGPFAYEVTDGSRLLHAGSIMDLGTVRAFADPEGTLEQHRHHTYQLMSYEFDVRVPAAALRDVALSNVAIALYRVKVPDHVGSQANILSEASLVSQRGEGLREIGRVTGIAEHFLTPDLRQEEPRPAADRSRGIKSRDAQRDADREGRGGETSE
jgi:hypothetical protein